MQRTARRRALWVLAGMVAAGLTVAEAGAQSTPGYTFRSNVNEVRLTFVATDHQRRRVATLAPTEVAVVDNETIIRQFRSFTRSTELTLNVMVLVDCSGSLAPQFSAQISNVLQVVSDSRWRPGDSVSVISFCGSRPQLICSKDCHDRAGEDRMASLQPEGLTPLFDAVVYGARTLEAAQAQDQTSKAVLVVFSDGDDTISHSSVADAIRAAQQADAAIYTVDPNKRKAGADGTSVLEAMADATGGLNLSLEDGVAAAFAAILNDLRSAYVLTYAPPRSEQPEHWVRVLPTRDLNLTFRSRQGYRAALD